MGERRYRAAKAAGLKTIPVIIRQTADNDLLREALIENIHRSQLNALEEAAAYSQLLNDFSCTHEELAQKLGRSRPLISNTIRLMNLPTSVQSKVASGEISAGHARALLGLSDAQMIESLAKRIISEGLSVRAVEELISQKSPKNTKKKIKTVTSSVVEFNEIADRIGDALDTRVSIQGSIKKGTIVIEFAGAEDLKRISKTIEG
jgi:ParB family chromosome partitioning protein